MASKVMNDAPLINMISKYDSGSIILAIKMISSIAGFSFEVKYDDAH